MNDQVPFFSIIIPTFNRATSIGKTIDSILNQSINNLEIIIVDDGSTDNTSEVVGSSKDSRVRYNKIKNSERGAARNHGLKQAAGTYVNFFDSDDLFLPCLEELQTFILKMGNPEVVYGGIQLVENTGKEIPVTPPPFRSFTKNLFHNNFLSCGSVFLIREVALKYPFNEDRRLSSAEDWELWLRIHANYPFNSFPKIIFQQVQHSGRSVVTIDPEKVELRDNYFATLVRNNEHLKTVFGIQALNLFVADRFTFIALSWVSTNKAKALSYWIKALKASMLVIQRKRCWAILKNLVTG